MDSITKRAYWNLSLSLIITFIVFVVFSLTQGLIAFILHTASEVTLERVLYSQLGLISTISSVMGILIIMLFVKYKNNSIRNYLNLHLPNIKTSLILIFLFFCLMAIMEHLSDYYPDIFYTDFVIESYRQTNNLPVFYLGVVFLGPIFEESLFRGFLFKGIEKSPIGGKGAVFISAILFALVHIQYGFYILLFMIFPLALLLGYARLKSGSLLLPILLHSINNLVTCLVTHFEIY